MSATGNWHRRRGRQNKVGHNTSVLAWKSGFGKCSQNQRSRTSGELGLSRHDPQPPRHSGSLHRDWLHGQCRAEFRGIFGFVNESSKRDSSQFPLGKRWLRVTDLSWRTRVIRVNPDMGCRGRQRNAQRNRSSTTPSGRAGQTPTERAAGPNVARWRQLSAQRFSRGRGSTNVMV